MPIPAKNTFLTDLLERKLGVKRQSARSYASQLRKLFNMGKHEGELRIPMFLDSDKTVRTVRSIVNVGQRKNMAVAALSGSRAADLSQKRKDQYRKIMLSADQDYKNWAKSGVRNKGFTGSAEQHWKAIMTLHKKIGKVVSTLQLYKRAELTHEEVVILQELVYARLLYHYEPRRLEAATLRFISPEQLTQLTTEDEEELNYILTGKKWTIVWNKYKTRKTYGRQEYPIPPGFKTVLRKIKNSLYEANPTGLIFFNRSGRQMGFSQFSQFIKRIFMKYLNKKWTQNTVRSIRISTLFKDAPSTRALLNAQEGMGSAITTQLMHYRVPQTKNT